MKFTLKVGSILTAIAILEFNMPKDYLAWLSVERLESYQVTEEIKEMRKKIKKAAG